MESSLSAKNTIGTILREASLSDDVDHRINEFYAHLIDDSFRPFSNQVTNLPLVGALVRWSDLKDGVREQLYRVIVSKWKVFAELAETTPAKNAPTVPQQPSEHGSDTKDKKPPASLLTTNQTPVVVDSYFQVNTRRDWFDRILDFVAAAVQPFVKAAS